MDEMALNYNSDAQNDDESCEYYAGPFWYVSTDGANGLGYGSEEYPFSGIQYAIDVASDGDHIYVESGAYFENLYIEEGLCKSIDLKGWWIDAGTPERIEELETKLV